MRGSFEPAAHPGKRRGVRAVRVAVAKRRVAPGKMTRSHWWREEVEPEKRERGMLNVGFFVMGPEGVYEF